jgi:hypothetical protein
VNQAEESSAVKRDHPLRSLRRTHGKWLRLWVMLQVAATFPLIAQLSDGTHPERVPDLILFWLAVAGGSTVLFYPWLAHYRLWRGR